MSRKGVFLFGNSQQSDALTQIVIRHCTAQEEAKNSLKALIRPFWSLVEQADNLRKLFIYEIIQCLTDNKGRYPGVAKAIIVDWSRYVSYNMVAWTQIYQAVETNTPLPPSCSDLSVAVYRTLLKWDWHVATEGARSYKEGGEMLCNAALVSLQIWLDYRKGFSYGDMSAQIFFHSYAYSVQWEKVAQALYDKDENEHLLI
ncbi:MAG TPA: hypothetical protein VL485_01805 [Ktedonobacteraceae bacterium]|nr:hypothetical protein [Ktedonobacteraceae bacterium]